MTRGSYAFKADGKLYSEGEELNLNSAKLRKYQTIESSGGFTMGDIIGCGLILTKR